MRPHKIPDNSIRRIARYFRLISELEADGVDFVSSRELGALLGCTPSQVRQDLSFFGRYGLQGYGYAVGLLYHDLVHIFGADRHFPAVVVGVGNIGSELLETRALQSCGYEVVAAFDAAREHIGREINGVLVRDISELADVLSEKSVVMAALCLPENEAEAMTERLLALGVKGFWNITGREYALPWGAVNENLRLADSLMGLGYRLKQSLPRPEASGE